MKNFTNELNTDLSALNARLLAGFQTTKNPPAFIVALPRTGSTLFQQVILSGFELGYVTNIMARFWKAPCVGAALQADLMYNGFVSSFSSKFGNTMGPLEPHEWGWFWQDKLRLEGDVHYIESHNSINWEELAATLGCIENHLNAPLLFDNVFAMANLTEIRSHFRKVLAVNITRDPFFICNSIINAGQDRNGGIDEFYGHRPRNIEEVEAISDPVEMVVFQVRSLINETLTILDSMKKEDVFTIAYEKLVSDPGNAIEDYAAFLAGHGHEVRWKNTWKPKPFQSRNNHSLIRDNNASILKKAFAKYF